MGEAIKKAIGNDLKGYKIFSYPTDNFGLITSYENSLSDGNFLCDMLNCIGINDSAQVDWLSLNDFAGVGSGGSITLEEKQKSKFAVEVLLPKIYDVVGINGGFEKEKETVVTLNIGKAYLRKLRRDKIVEYIEKLDNSKSIKRAFLNGKLVLVVADCVIENMSVTVKVDQEISASLDAKLGVTGSTVAAKVFQDASLSVKFEKKSEGVYTFSISHPVIFARLTKKQPTAGYLNNDEFFESWETVKSDFEDNLIKLKK
ncbi:hypothetical protein QWT87_03595 [Chryseobacterium sp. APV1]|uniref:Uncharacterized protein n=1 Tax=Chryseobacterium urinae TaxID=3058400 RepID=A0ABT8TYT9_9FLAO|nr:hypothetical protein [Chryseobacterium sp. APV1]MDO3423961.1 hypothetical protein [Chryseobacterium sp. APV1]